jgi:hypothetical protein
MNFMKLQLFYVSNLRIPAMKVFMVSNFPSSIIIFFASGNLRNFCDDFCDIFAKIASSLSVIPFNSSHQPIITSSLKHFDDQLIAFINTLKNCGGFGNTAGNLALHSDVKNHDWMNAVQTHKIEVTPYTLDATHYRAYLENIETQNKVVNMFYALADASKRV